MATTFLGTVWAFTLALATAQDPGQTNQPLRPPADLRAALLALPVAAPVAEGTPVQVVDATGKPLAGARVHVAEAERWATVRQRVQDDVAGDLERQMLAPLLWAGTAYATSDAGQVMVTTPPMATVYAVTDTGVGIGVWRPDSKPPLTIQVLPTRSFRIQIRRANGKPASALRAEIGAFGERGRDRFETLVAAPTGHDGEVALRLPGLFEENATRRGARVVAQVAVVGGEPVRVAPVEGATTVLQLPPAGQVVVRLHGADERPRPGLRDVELALPNAPRLPPEQRPVAFRRDDGEAWFAPVALGVTLEARVRAAGVAGEVSLSQPGPTHDGELVVFGVRVATGAPGFSARLHDRDGQLLRGQSIAVLFVTDTLAGVQEATTEPDGQVFLALPPAFAAAGGSMHVVRRLGTDGADTVPGGALVQQVPPGAAGLTPLGELTLQAEPVAFAGRLVDAAGRPIAGVSLQAVASWLGERRGEPSRHRRPGPAGRALVHRVTSDADGRFTFHELAPGAEFGPFVIEGEQWTVAEGFRAAAGAAVVDVPVRRAAIVQVTFRSKPPRVLAVQLLGSNGRPVAGPRIDTTSGTRSFRGIAPGRYTLLLRLQARELLRFTDVQVAADGSCDDQRLRDIDWAVGLRVVTLRVVSDRGGVLNSANLRRLDARGVARGGTFGLASQPEILVLEPDEQDLVVGHEHFVTQLVERPLGELTVTLQPRSWRKVRLPDGVTLPAGTVLQLTALGFPARLGQPARAVWLKDEALLAVDGPGDFRLQLLTSERPDAAVVWSQDVSFAATTGTEDYTAPITAEVAAAVVAARSAK